MTALKEIRDSVLHLLFPHICLGCGNDILPRESSLCLRCLESMPETRFELFPGNPVENLFRGRLSLVSGCAHYFFTRESLMQQLMHLFKYKNNQQLGIQLGKMMGKQLSLSGRFDVDALVPLPLFPAKEKKRGYNQATLLCEGISEETGIPILDKVVIRPEKTETQTRKGRIERWQNMEGKFMVTDPGLIRGKHILLVDDVITTGATLESCGNELTGSGEAMLSVAALCIASR